MMKTVFRIGFFAVLGLVSCARVEELGRTENYIGYDITVGGRTRAVETTTSNIRQISVTAAKGWRIDEEIYFFDQRVNIGSDGSCSIEGDPVIWPQNSYLYFYTYGPAGDQDGAISTNQVVPDPSLPWRKFIVRPDDDPSKQIDFVFSETGLNEYEFADNNNRVHLELGHAESQLRLCLDNDDSTMVFKVRNWGIRGVAKSGLYNRTNTYPIYYFWTCLNEVSADSGYVCTVNSQEYLRYSTPATLKGEDGSVANMIIIPQEQSQALQYGEDSKMDGAYVFVTMAIAENDGKDTPILEETVCCWPLDLKLEPGYSYTICIDPSEAGYYETDQDADKGLDPIFIDRYIDVFVEGTQEWDAVDEAELPVEDLPRTGVFRVDGAYVVFSPGNLMYQPSTGTWKFSENLYMNDFDSYADDIDDAHERAASDKWITLFGWATSGKDNGNQLYLPADDLPEDASGLASPSFGPVDKDGGMHGFSKGDGEYSQFDWGRNPISNGGGHDDWCTMSYQEWNGLFNDSKWLFVKVEDICYGLVVFPDGWNPERDWVVVGGGQRPQYYEYKQSVISRGTAWDISEAQLQRLIHDGAVFLPFAGVRGYVRTDPADLTPQADFCRSVEGYGVVGSYWTSSYDEEDPGNHSFGTYYQMYLQEYQDIPWVVSDYAAHFENMLRSVRLVRVIRRMT